MGVCSQLSRVLVFVELLDTQQQTRDLEHCSLYSTPVVGNSLVSSMQSASAKLLVALLPPLTQISPSYGVSQSQLNKVMRVGSIMSSATLIESTILLNDRHPILSIFLLLVHFRNQKHHGQINFILMNFFRILCIVTYQLWPLQLWRLLEAQNHLANTNFGT